jgi:phosphoglycerate-specific signal transduction histidine kinase
MMEITVSLTDEDVLSLTTFQELFSGFAHEIAQPLNAIMIASQVIQLKMEATSLTADEKAFFVQRLNIVTSQVQKVSHLLESFRQFSRRGQTDSRGPADVHVVFTKVYSLMAQQFAARGIQVTVEAANDLPLILKHLGKIEGAIVQGLAFARDTISAIGQWHGDAGIDYERSLRIDLMVVDGVSGMCLLWNKGQMSEETAHASPDHHAGLRSAGSVLRSMGGVLETGVGSLRLVFSK